MKYSLIYSASLLFSLVAAVHSAADSPYSHGKRLLKKRLGPLDGKALEDLAHQLGVDLPFNPDPDPAGSGSSGSGSSTSSDTSTSSSANSTSTATGTSSSGNVVTVTSTENTFTTVTDTGSSSAPTGTDTGSSSSPTGTNTNTSVLPATSTTSTNTTPTSDPTSGSSTGCGLLGLGLLCDPTTTPSSSSPTATDPGTTTKDTSTASLPTGTSDPATTPTPTDPTTTPTPTDPATTSSTTASTSSPTACIGLLGVDLLCTPTHTATTSPTATDPGTTTKETTGPTGTSDTTTTTPTTTTSPTGCVGILGLDLICTPTSSPTSEPTQPPTSEPPTSVPPTITSDTTSNTVTSDPSTITSQPTSQSITSDSATITSDSSTVTISFPGSATTTASGTDVSTTTDATTTTVATTISVASDLSYVLSETTLAFTSVPTTTLPATLSDPDSNPTSLSDSTPTAATTLSVAPLPTGLPARIYPKTVLDTSTIDTSKFTLISILFDSGLNWPFVVTSNIASGQIFAYMPAIISNSLGIDASQVLTLALQVYIPSSYKSTSDSAQLGTMFLAYIPSDRVNDLAALIKAKSSVFYTGLADPVATQLADHVNSGFSLKAVSDPNNTSGTVDNNGSSQSNSNTSSGSSKSRQDAIIGVVSALGAAALLVLAFLVFRSIQRKKEMAHRRLSDPPAEMSEEEMDRLGYRPQGRDFDRDSLGGQRRRSFYFAEDSLRGFEAQQQHQQPMAQQAGQGASYSYLQEREGAQGMSRRNVGPTLVPGAISAPILRENTMNW